MSLASALQAKAQRLRPTATVLTTVTGRRTTCFPALDELAANHPELLPAAKLLAVGVDPAAAAIRARSSGAPAAAVMVFVAALDAHAAAVASPRGPGPATATDFPRPADAHGVAGSPSWALPRRTHASDLLARPDYASLPAHEYQDGDDVLRAKAKAVASMMRRGRQCVVYTGAGISTAAGIRDYASKPGGAAAAVGSAGAGSGSGPRPTVAHLAMALIVKHGVGADRDAQQWLWIDQNHDGLAVRAGCPQAQHVAIHGEIGSAANPVVAMSGSLRPDLLARLEAWERSADVVLALGSSLCGMRSDGIVARVAQRAAAAAGDDEPGNTPPVALGTVIVSLQRTPHDATSSFRAFAQLDDFAAMLCDELGLADELRQRIASQQPLPALDGAEVRGELFRPRECETKDQ